MTQNRGDGSEIRAGMVLSAGFGTRMAPLTDTTPKPLVRFAGKALVDWGLERFQDAGFEHLVINTHYHADQIQAYFADRPEVTLTYEPVLQDSGGGVRDALPFLGEDAFFAANADCVWLDGVTPTIERFRQAWSPQDMDILLLLIPVHEAQGYDGLGDYFYTDGQTIEHRGERSSAPFAYAGVQILKPSLFDDAPKGPFSLRDLYHKVEAQGRLAGITHDGPWYHIGTVKALSQLEPLFIERIKTMSGR